MAQLRYHSQTVLVGATLEFELYPPKGGERRSLFIQNQDGNVVYINEDTHADSSTTQIGGGLYASYDQNTGVPAGKIYIKGSQAGNAQRVFIKQGVA